MSYSILYDEHRVIKKRISELHLNDKSIEKLDELGNILKNHIRTEERELFPMIQKFFGDEKLNELENKIESVAELQKRKSQKDN
jgi:hemerythrin-like domain-containing protein